MNLPKLLKSFDGGNPIACRAKEEFMPHFEFFLE
jgi:hypothetical protein